MKCHVKLPATSQICARDRSSIRKIVYNLLLVKVKKLGDLVTLSDAQLLLHLFKRYAFGLRIHRRHHNELHNHHHRE